MPTNAPDALGPVRLRLQDAKERRPPRGQQRAPRTAGRPSWSARRRLHLGSERRESREHGARHDRQQDLLEFQSSGLARRRRLPGLFGQPEDDHQAGH